MELDRSEAQVEPTKAELLLQPLWKAPEARTVHTTIGGRNPTSSRAEKTTTFTYIGGSRCCTLFLPSTVELQSLIFLRICLFICLFIHCCNLFIAVGHAKTAAHVLEQIWLGRNKQGRLVFLESAAGRGSAFSCSGQLWAMS